MRVESPVFEDSHMDHKFPVSVGFSVHKYLTPRLHIGTGLVYTYMSSKAEIEGAFNYRYRQRLHYLGIPLNQGRLLGALRPGTFRHLFLGRSDGRVRLVCARDDRTVRGPGFRFVRDSQDRGRTALCGRSIWVWASVSIWWIISVFMWNRRSAIISRTSASLHPIGRKILGTSIWAWDSAINSDVSREFALPDATFCPGCASCIVNSVL